MVLGRNFKKTNEQQTTEKYAQRVAADTNSKAQITRRNKQDRVSAR